MSYNKGGDKRTMRNVSYVYPSVTGMYLRRGLLERLHSAKELGCDYIEMPADTNRYQLF